MLPVETTMQQDPREKHEEAFTSRTNETNDEEMSLDDPERDVDDMPEVDDEEDEA